MSIDHQLFLIVGGFALAMLIPAWQSFQLRAIYRSGSSAVGALTFLMLAGKNVYGFLRLRANIADARAKGIMIDHLTPEQWIVGVVWSFAIAAGFIWWLHWQHRDLKKLGV